MNHKLTVIGNTVVVELYIQTAVSTSSLQTVQYNTYSNELYENVAHVLTLFQSCYRQFLKHCILPLTNIKVYKVSKKSNAIKELSVCAVLRSS